MIAPIRRRLARAGISILFVLVLATTALGVARADVEVFTRDGCPHCAEAKQFLDALGRQRPGLRVVYRDVVADPAAAAELRALAREHALATVGVPTFRLRDRVLVGFSPATAMTLEAMLDGREQEDAIELPILGTIRVADVGLPAFTIVVGLLDGFNPCATWVLLLVLSLLVNVHDRARMVAIGGTFVAVSGLAYFAFMAAWLNVFLWIGLSRASELALGAVALVVGLVGLRDAARPGAHATFAIPESAKPGLYARMRRILHAESVAAAAAASAALAVVVNLVELACTAGLPLLYTRILTLQPLTTVGYYGYLALYNAAYVADDAALLTLAVVTLSRLKLQEKAGRVLKLVSALVMLALAAMLFLRPEWLARLG